MLCKELTLWHFFQNVLSGSYEEPVNMNYVVSNATVELIENLDENNKHKESSSNDGEGDTTEKYLTKPTEKYLAATVSVDKAAVSVSTNTSAGHKHDTLTYIKQVMRICKIFLKN